MRLFLEGASWALLAVGFFYIGYGLIADADGLVAAAPLPLLASIAMSTIGRTRP